MEFFGGFLPRFALPAVLIGIVASLLFCPMALGLRSFLAEPVREVLHDDMTQFTQNYFSLESLLFGLLASNTLSFLFQRQERLFRAIYREVTETQALVEQLTLIAAFRRCDSGSEECEVDLESVSILDDVAIYLTEDLELIGEPNVLPQRQHNSVDPLERLLFATSVGVPSFICSSVRAIRQARAERLAAVQRRFPAAHLLVLGFFVFSMLLSFVVLGAGMAGFENVEVVAQPGHLLFLLSVLFGGLVAALALGALVFWELANPGSSGPFGVRTVVQEALAELIKNLKNRAAASQTC